MRTNKIVGLFIGACIFAFSACEPIEDRDDIFSNFNPDFELVAEGSSPGSNKFTLKVEPAVPGYWDYNLDTIISNEIELVFPYSGEHTFTFHSFGAHMPNNDPSDVVANVSKSITYTVTEMDEPINDEFHYLVGDNLEGKTWVFDRTDPDRWWYMTDEDWEVFWWQPETVSDVDGRMVFDLDGGPNFTYYSGPDADPMPGRFVFLENFTKIRIEGETQILGVEGGAVNNDGSKEYQIMEFTADRLVLFQNNMAWSPGWVWVFKPKAD